MVLCKKKETKRKKMYCIFFFIHSTFPILYKNPVSSWYAYETKRKGLWIWLLRDSVWWIRVSSLFSWKETDFYAEAAPLFKLERNLKVAFILVIFYTRRDAHIVDFYWNRYLYKHMHHDNVFIRYYSICPPVVFPISRAHFFVSRFSSAFLTFFCIKNTKIK